MPVTSTTRAQTSSMRVFAAKSEEQRLLGKAEFGQIRADLVTACERVNANDAVLNSDSEKFLKVLASKVERVSSSAADAHNQTVD